MLALRLARGGSPLALLRRLPVACAAGIVALLLLTALSHALAHPQQPGASLLRLGWCLVPLAAAAQFAAAVARTEPGVRTRSALEASGVGPAGVTALAAVSASLTALPGCAAALFLHLHLRGESALLPLDGAAAGLLAAGRPLPVAATLVLLSVPPLAIGAAAAYANRPGTRTRTGRDQDRDRDRSRDGHPDGSAADLRVLPAASPAPDALPWGIACIATGLAVVAYASRTPEPVTLPAVTGGDAPGVLGGWTVSALGLVLAGPGLTQLCGRLLASGRPGAVRLLAGRVLEHEAVRVGRPLGVLSAVVAGGLAAVRLYEAAPQDGAREFGPLTLLAAALVVGCVAASALTAAAEAHAERAPTGEALAAIGAPRRVLRGAAALRAAAVCGVLGALSWGVARLVVLPLTT